MSRGLSPGDLIHAKPTDGTFDFKKVYIVVEAWCSPEDFRWVVSAYSYGKPPKVDRIFDFDNVQKIGPLVHLALCASNDDDEGLPPTETLLRKE